jgi:hypothetical protein
MIGYRLHAGGKPWPGLVLLGKWRLGILAARIFQRRCTRRAGGCFCASAGAPRCAGRGHANQRRLPEDEELLLIPELLPELLPMPDDEP